MDDPTDVCWLDSIADGSFYRPSPGSMYILVCVKDIEITCSHKSRFNRRRRPRGAKRFDIGSSPSSMWARHRGTRYYIVQHSSVVTFYPRH